MPRTTVLPAVAVAGFVALLWALAALPRKASGPFPAVRFPEDEPALRPEDEPAVCRPLPRRRVHTRRGGYPVITRVA